MGDDIPDDAESGFSKRETGGQKPERAVCHLDRQLACQAVYYVRNCISVSVRGVQKLYHP